MKMNICCRSGHTHQKGFMLKIRIWQALLHPHHFEAHRKGTHSTQNTQGTHSRSAHGRQNKKSYDLERGQQGGGSTRNTADTASHGTRTAQHKTATTHKNTTKRETHKREQERNGDSNNEENARKNRAQKQRDRTKRKTITRQHGHGRWKRRRRPERGTTAKSVRLLRLCILYSLLLSLPWLLFLLLTSHCIRPHIRNLPPPLETRETRTRTGAGIAVMPLSAANRGLTHSELTSHTPGSPRTSRSGLGKFGLSF